jgi:crossover junction endodeoxyribonuclease RusA
MALMLTVTLPFPPSTNALWRAVRGRNIKSEPYRKWEAEAMGIVMAERPRLNPHKVTGPYSISIVAERPDARRRDLGNLEKAASDLLVTMGLIHDDCDAERIELRWSGIAPKKPGRVHVTVSPI